MTGSANSRRAKISVSVDRRLLRAVDSYVEQHADLDRSKIIDQALLGWYAVCQDRAMLDQYAAPATPQEDAEYEAWSRIRDAAAEEMLERSSDQG